MSNIFRNLHHFRFFPFQCRRKDAQGKRKKTPDRVRMCQRRRRARALQHQAALREAEAVHDSIVINEPSLHPSSPQSPPPPPPPLSTPPLLVVSRPVSRRLTIQAAGITPESAQSTPSVAESPPAGAVAPSCPGSPEICSQPAESQESLHEYAEQGGLSRRYPTIPAAPRKDQYIPSSESEAESSDSERPLRRLPAMVFRKGQLMYHKAYDGPKPITFVDTRLYQGGCMDYITAFNDDEVGWLRTISDLMDAHNIPKRNVL